MLVGTAVNDSATPDDPRAMADDPTSIGQDEIERLLSQATSRGVAPADSGGTGPFPAGASSAKHSDQAPAMATGDVEFLLSQAQAALASVDAPRPAETHPPAL